MRVSLPIILAFVVATMVIAVFLTTIAVRSQRRRIKTGMEGLIGEKAVVKSWSEKNGKVFVHGELWEAKSENVLEEGKQAEIVGFEGMKLIVK
jgi:membrane-bound serine protease (ClpP class)